MKLADQARCGAIIGWALLTALLAPVFIQWLPLPQAPTIEGVFIRDNQRNFPRFLATIKRHQGVLVLGTSETAAHLSGQNYWALLNRDRDVAPYFSVLGGAGRCSYMWFPTILANPEAFKGLRVLYYLNPTYWRYDLNGFAVRYYDRYNSPELVQSIREKAAQSGLTPFIAPYLNHQPAALRWTDRLAAVIKVWKSFYSYDLKSFWQRPMTQKSRSYRNPGANEIAMWQDGLDLEKNVTHDYAVRNRYDGIPPVSPSTFQFEALQAFIGLARDSAIDLVVFIGPYNGILARRNSPEVIAGYAKALADIKRLLHATNVKYIDGTDLAFQKGVFNDAQHHSAFGAWKIEQRIAPYYQR